ncbi:MAG: TIGR04211 family SH3 domain-containing protein [Acidiferrobacterales bacterium]
MRAVYFLLAFFLAVPPVFAETAYVSDKVFIDLRGGPHYESPVVHKILAGTALEVLGKVGDFSHVSDGTGREGWIENRELTAEVPARLRYAALERELAGMRTELAKTQEQLRQTQVVLDQDDADQQALVKAQAKLKRQLAGARARLAKSREELQQTQAALAQAAAQREQLAARLAEAATNQPAMAAAPALPAPLVTADLASTTVTQSAVELEPAGEGLPMAVVGHGSGDEPQPEPVPEPDFKQRFLDFVGVLDLLWLGISFAMLIMGFVVGAVWLRERNRRRLGGMYLRI